MNKQHLPSAAGCARSAFAAVSSFAHAALPASAAQCSGDSPSSLLASASRYISGFWRDFLGLAL